MHSKDKSEYIEKNPIPETVMSNTQYFRDYYHRLAVISVKGKLGLIIYSVFMTIVSIVLTIALAYFTTRIHDRVIAVQIDPNSGARLGVTELKASQNAQVPDKAIQYFLITDVVAKLRNVPLDRNQYLKNISTVYSFMTPTTKKKFEEFINSQTDTKQVFEKKIGTIATNITSFTTVPNAKNTYQLRWNEVYIEGSNEVSRRSFVAIMTITFRQTDSRDYSTNPFGILITDVSITQENVSN